MLRPEPHLRNLRNLRISFPPRHPWRLRSDGATRRVLVRSVPPSSFLLLHPSFLIPHSSLLTLHSSFLVLRSSSFRPHPSSLIPHSSFPHSSFLTLHSSFFLLLPSRPRRLHCYPPRTGGISVRFQSGFGSITSASPRPPAILSRLAGPLRDVVEYAKPHRKPKGTIVLYKTRDCAEEPRKAGRVLARHKLRLTGSYDIRLPLSSVPRRFVVLGS